MLDKLRKIMFACGYRYKSHSEVKCGFYNSEGTVVYIYADGVKYSMFIVKGKESVEHNNLTLAGLKKVLGYKPPKAPKKPSGKLKKAESSSFKKPVKISKKK